MNGQYAAHEVLGMHEALMTKSTNIQMLNLFSELAVDGRLKEIARKQSQAVLNHYNQGVALIQGQPQMQMQMPTGVQYSVDNFGRPNIGLNTQPSQIQSTTSNMSPMQREVRNQATGMGTVSDRAICTTMLNMHKFGCIAWMTFALECANMQFRQYLVEGANNCDKMAYEIWSYMNIQGYYQVPQMPTQTVQTMAQQYQPYQTYSPSPTPSAVQTQAYQTHAQPTSNYMNHHLRPQ